MRNKVLIALLMFVMSLTFVAAESNGFTFQNSTADTLFTIDKSGNIAATGTISEGGSLLSNLYCALTGCTMTGNLVTGAGINITAGSSGYFKGDGSLLTGITVADDSIQIKYQNVTTWPNCGANEHLDSDGSTLSCTTTVDTEIDPIFAANFTNMQVDCPAGNYSYGIFGNGTLKCRNDETGAGASVDYDNIAMLNQTNTGNITLSNDFYYRWASGAWVVGDTNGDITFKLGA